MSKAGFLLETKTESDSDVPLIGNEKTPVHSYGLDQDIPNSMSKSVNNDQDQDLLHKDESTANSKCWNPLKLISALAVETTMFTFMFCYMLRATITSNMIMDKACQFRLNYSIEICGNLSNHTEVKDEVEKIANNFNLYLNLLHMGPAAVVMMFVGPWSDKYGRKPPLLVTVVGTVLDDIGMILNSFFFEAKLEYMLLASVPTGLSGGFICFLTIMFSLISEVNAKARRTLRYAFAELAFGLGMTCGSLVGGLIYNFSKSYLIVYVVATVGHVVSGLCVIIVITETKGLNSHATWKKKLCDAFTLERIVEGFTVCIKPRENRGRAKIWLLFLSMCAIVVTYESFSSIGYTYVHHRFDWDPSMYSYVNSVSSAVGLVVMTICVPLFTRILKIRDANLGIIGTVSAIAKNICVGFASKPWIYYVGTIVGLLFAIGTLSTRSMLSKLVPDDELGKVFSFMSMCEALVPLAGTIAITNIFNATLSFFPGLCYLIACAVLVIPLGAFIWIATVAPNGYETVQQKDDSPSATEKNVPIP